MTATKNTASLRDRLIDERLEFTVLGDSVNVAARLQEVAKERDLSLVVSDALLRRAGGAADPAFAGLPVDRVRGRRGELALFALASRPA
ncbi:MAG: hypothetical protein AAFX81_17440 [Pseudomonadota bacterium]